MSGLLGTRFRLRAGLRCLMVLIPLLLASTSVSAQQRREREPNSVYEQRRAQLAAQVDGPIVLWGFTGREESSQSYVFAQEDNFYYLTGHNEEGAGLILLPALKTGASDKWTGPREILFLPSKNPEKERWNGVRLSPADPDIQARTGFAAVKPFEEMRATVEKLAKDFPDFYTILPYQKENGGYPHEKAVVDWLGLAAPQARVKDIRLQIYKLREIKSAGEIAFLEKAIDLSLDAHLEAMKMMRPGLYEYRSLQKWSKFTPWEERRRKATPRLSARGLTRLFSITTSSAVRSRMATLWSSTWAPSTPAIPRT